MAAAPWGERGPPQAAAGVAGKPGCSQNVLAEAPRPALKGAVPRGQGRAGKVRQSRWRGSRGREGAGGRGRKDHESWRWVRRGTREAETPSPAGNQL